MSKEITNPLAQLAHKHLCSLIEECKGNDATVLVVCHMMTDAAQYGMTRAAMREEIEEMVGQ